MIQKYHHAACFKLSRYMLVNTSYLQNDLVKRHINDFKRITLYNIIYNIKPLKSSNTRLQSYLYILHMITGYADHNRLIVLLPIICAQKVIFYMMHNY